MVGYLAPSHGRKCPGRHFCSTPVDPSGLTEQQGAHAGNELDSPSGLTVTSLELDEVLLNPIDDKPSSLTTEIESKEILKKAVQTSPFFWAVP
eukprot:CAMPEP_0181060346 /NCGR_PEP_ID=MMETSP1070-20121207/21908_1 /TAXON_ID=265543 /ORGANISM="Minutocellus polymorphus, Strain NH13" /LENGTH=92 /DNA_ID=CAMNT_0023140167 /DNA_START=928 /DNA_END=1206 /DNA_ORIENTATION=+